MGYSPRDHKELDTTERPTRVGHDTSLSLLKLPFTEC